ncbi:MAG: hypothetical protein ACXV3A_10075 [Kineosporiaceae bacterium]
MTTTPGDADQSVPRSAMLFDLDGTLIDSVYQHVAAWHEALLQSGITVSVWKLHRRIGMSGGLFLHALQREIAVTEATHLSLNPPRQTSSMQGAREAGGSFRRCMRDCR